MNPSQTMIAEYSRPVSLHVWQVGQVSDRPGLHRLAEIELTASHTSDCTHLDPACPTCDSLRSRLLSLARHAVERIRHTLPDDTSFDVLSDMSAVVCSSGNGQSPAVAVSIYISGRPNGEQTNGMIPGLQQLKRALADLGVREA